MTRTPRIASPRLRGEDKSSVARPGEGAPPDEARSGAPPHPVASRLDLSPQAGRGKEQAGRGEAGLGGNWVLLGEFGRAHGLRGEVRLKSFTAAPHAIAGYGPLTTDRGQALVLTGVRPAAGAAPDILVARIQGVATREAADALNRTRLFVARDRLGEADDADEFFLADLIGLAAEDEAGGILGRIVAVPDYGGGDLIEIAPAHGAPTLLVPFTKACVPVVDLAAGRVVVVPPIETSGEPADERG